MSDELETPTPEAEETPEVDPLAEEKAALEAQKAELAKQEASLKKGFNEIAEREKAVASKAIPATPDDPIDPELEKQLAPYIARAVQTQYGGTLEAAQAAFLASVESEMERFAEKSGVPAEALNDAITAYGLRPADTSLASVREVFEKAATIHKASTFDREAELAKLREEILKAQAEGETVDAVRPIRTEVGGEPDLETMKPAERYTYLKNKGVNPDY